MAYRLGVGVARSDTEARKWLGLSAGQGNKMAQFELGECHINGDGAPETVADGIRFLRVAADQGHSEAQYVLGQVLCREKRILKL